MIVDLAGDHCLNPGFEDQNHQKKPFEKFIDYHFCSTLPAFGISRSSASLPGLPDDLLVETHLLRGVDDLTTLVRS